MIMLSLAQKVVVKRQRLQCILEPAIIDRATTFINRDLVSRVSWECIGISTPSGCCGS